MGTVSKIGELPSSQKPHARLGTGVVSLLVLGIVLGTAYQLIRSTGLIHRIYCSSMSLVAVLCLVGSGWLVIRRVYTIPRITIVFAIGAILLPFSQIVGILSHIEQIRPYLIGPHRVFLTEFPIFVGISMLFACFYMCLLETHASKRRVTEHAEELAQEIAERERVEGEFQRSENNFRVLTETSTAATFIHQGAGFVYANKAATTFTGYNKEEMNEFNFWDIIHPDFRDIVRERGIARLSDEETPPARYELAILHRDGQTRWLDMSVGTIEFEGQPAVLGTFFDITDRKEAEKVRRELEDQVQRSQKLESLGVLAGGIAHDFNNLLMGILGNADLALLDVPEDSRVRENIRGIENAARRAADLSRQMLAYSGKGRFIVEPTDIGSVLTEIGNLIASSVSKKAVLTYELAPNLPTIEADATQMRQVFMNLITNASEALADNNGTITVRTGAMQCDRDYLRSTYLNEELEQGPYVYCEVSDTGCGMDAETSARIFDPFYTTKFTGRGLGLAAVLGIVRGHSGAIRVYSELGRGTTFKILFPASGRGSVCVPVQEPAASQWKGKGTVLLVDDEEAVRHVGSQMLEKAGFNVLTATDGRDALEVFQKDPRKITCVLLDLTMPNMDGQETFRELLRINKGIRVILSSGYNEQDAVNRFTQKGLAGFIQKPYQYAALLQKLREVLEPAPKPELMA